MVWAGISGAGQTPLKRFEGVMDTKFYNKILFRLAIPSGLNLLGPCWVFFFGNGIYLHFLSDKFLL